jgi:hypothetical protein
LSQLVFQHATHAVYLLNLHGVRTFLVSLGLTLLLILQALLLQPFPLSLSLCSFSLLIVQVLFIEEAKPTDVGSVLGVTVKPVFLGSFHNCPKKLIQGSERRKLDLSAT